MPDSSPAPDSKHFDEYAASYDLLLASSLGWLPVHGGKAFFDRHKVDSIQRWVKGLLPDMRLLDFGCGTGAITTLLAREFGGCSVSGYDVSRQSLDIAGRQENAPPNLSWLQGLYGAGMFDMILMSNVLHHVCPADHETLLRSLARHLAPAGNIVVFEHNPLNPLTRRVVSRCQFDRGVRLLKPSEVLLAAGKASLRLADLRYVLVFPMAGRLSAFVERVLCRVPVGAQYMLILKNG